MRKIILSLSLSLLMIPGMAQERNFGPPTDGNDLDVTSSKTYNYDYLKWRFSFDFAYSARIAEVMDTGYAQINELTENLLTRIAYGLDIHNYIQRDWGLGVRFSGHSYSHSDFGVRAAVNSYYFAPSFIWRHFTKSGKGAWVLGASIGYLSYSDKLTSTIGAQTDELKFSNGALGTTLDVGYDIRLGATDTFLGFRITMFGGTVKITETVSTSVNALDMGVGLRF